MQSCFGYAAITEQVVLSWEQLVCRATWLHCIQPRTHGQACIHTYIPYTYTYTHTHPQTAAHLECILLGVVSLRNDWKVLQVRVERFDFYPEAYPLPLVKCTLLINSSVYEMSDLRFNSELFFDLLKHCKRTSWPSHCIYKWCIQRLDSSICPTHITSSEQTWLYKSLKQTLSIIHPFQHLIINSFYWLNILETI